MSYAITENPADWEYWCCPLDTDPSKFGPFTEAVALYKSRMGPDGQLPARQDFDFYDLKPWLGQIFLAKVEHDPFNLRFLIWGTTLSEWWGVDYTNKALGEDSSDPSLWKVELRYFKAMEEAPFIGIAGGGLTLHDRSFIRVIGIDFPLMGENGLSHVLSIHLKITDEQDIASTMTDCPITQFV